MQTRITAVLFSAALMLCFTVSYAPAQTVTGTLSGHITDPSGALTPKVSVKVVNESTGAVREGVTNDDGYFQINFVPIGSYDLAISQAGFRTIEKKGVVVELNKTTVSDFRLEVATVSTSVEVQGGELPLIDTTTGEVKTTLNERQVEATPLPGRNFISLVEQVPGFQPAAFDNSSNNPTNSTGSYAAFNGQGTRSSTFQIDGVNNDDSSENQNRQNVNISTIKEFQVLTNAYSAEFGRAGGAVVLVQTKSGTNHFHGDAYDFIQNDIFNANDYFLNQSGAKRPPVRRNQYGGTIGGPIWKNKLFFFGSGERVSNVGKGSISRFTWLPSDGPRACNVGETPAPGGPYCVDPATHPNIQRDLAFIKSVMNLWNTPELKGKTPNDPAACAQLIASGRPDRCVLVTGLGFTFPMSDYTGRMDWNTSNNTTMLVRYQYSRQQNVSPRIIMGDNFGTNNNRQYNLGYTLTHVFSPRQTGEFRYGFGNRNTNQEVTDGKTTQIPTIRFATTLVNPAASSDTIPFGGTIIGTSTNVPINRDQRDHQFVYNHTIVLDKHTLRAGIDQRLQALDDVASGTQRGFWTFGSINTATQVANGTGFTGWEDFLDGILTGYNQGYGSALAQNRFKETNLYFEDQYRLKPNLTLNLGTRWEGVGAPHEVKDRFSYGYGGDFNNVEPRIGFAWTPASRSGDLVIRGGYGIYHDRVFQSIFSQSGLNFRFQPPNGFLVGAPANPCAVNPGGSVSAPAGPVTVSGGQFEVSDPTCGFTFTPGAASRSVAAQGNGVRIAGGQLQTSLLIPDPNFHLPYVSQFNLTVEQKLPGQVAFSMTYAGNRGIGLPFFSGINDARFPVTSPLVSVDVGGGNFQPVVFDRVCKDFSDPICVTLNSSGAVVPGSSGVLKSFSALNSATASLAQKGIVIVNGVPHGYISLGSTASERVAERRPDPTNGRNVLLSNFARTYYNALQLKVTKTSSRGLTLSGWWTWSKTMDTGSEATFTGTDVNAPVGAVNPQRSLRALSSFDQPQRLVVSAVYELPWMKSQQGVLGELAGGWTISGVGTFASGLPFTVLAGYDENFDGVGGDRPLILNPGLLYTSIDQGRPQNPCPTSLVGGRCLDTGSERQLPASAFLPSQANLSAGDQYPVAPGQDFPAGSASRNAFREQGQKNVDAAVAKSFRIREGMGLQLRMEFYNVFNRVTFGIPARTIAGTTTPLGQISSTVNLQNYVNSARNTGARMGQLALRFTF
ncbi:MAG TPA: TonB-dependent receptor [Candidatus Sulfotelmatobacter sp.]|nr:TonB-dependent receptor [Candidatus Sulfotelmatobacter sp.]